VLMPQVRRLFPSGLVGRAVSTCNLFSFAGIFVTQWAMGVIINLSPKDPAGHYPPAAYTLALLMIAACTLAALLGYWPLLKKKA